MNRYLYFYEIHRNIMILRCYIGVLRPLVPFGFVDGYSTRENVLCEVRIVEFDNYRSVVESDYFWSRK